ncbi:hypothetical protein CHGG_08699 [Chaetomium globosum CBS 148.51]|uniref:Uncharacterized protein n=1 Tax=Chaetomium globosum (strain ATCC 6205 / CBS 148.51 / DSM 1962 / NBRC 6347 / NRRL 1970) TaxID=306901 RepID=Q2GTK5_CHAGB|nr:uncharacterized protein CHGG_08699 [Chaetomium globosum CBS 148.51]EAQ84685.1 hypothetical protein CHGG_08699 [Chaetomium globosum CBS 148.51]
MALSLADAGNKFEDLSGVDIKPGDNPYDALINACSGSPAKIQSLYATHRSTRNAQQREKFLSLDFKQLNIDPILLRLEKPDVEPGFQDPRHCLVFWARPPNHVVKLACHVQTLLQKAAPSKGFHHLPNFIGTREKLTSRGLDLWLMPSHRMHLTTLEIAHSRTAQGIADLVSSMRPAIPVLTGLHLHDARGCETP